MFARTQRLLLRPGWPEDAPALHSAINDAVTVGNLASAPWPYRLEDAESFLAIAPHALQPTFLIFRRTGGAPQLIGSIGFGRKDTPDLELGYWISRAHWGLGYATEAGHAVLDIAKSLGHRQMHAEHFVDNPASGNVLRKLGFCPTGRTAPRFSKGRNAKVQTVEFQISLTDDTDDECDAMRSLAA